MENGVGCMYSSEHPNNKGQLIYRYHCEATEHKTTIVNAAKARRTIKCYLDNMKRASLRLDSHFQNLQKLASAAITRSCLGVQLQKVIGVTLATDQGLLSGLDHLSPHRHVVRVAHPAYRPDPEPSTYRPME